MLKGTDASSPAALPSLAEMFQLKPGEWDCGHCWTRIKSYAFRCMSCEIGISPDAPESDRRRYRAFCQGLEEQHVTWEKELADYLQRASAENADSLQSSDRADQEEPGRVCALTCGIAVNQGRTGTRR